MLIHNPCTNYIKPFFKLVLQPDKFALESFNLSHSPLPLFDSSLKKQTILCTLIFTTYWL